MSLPEKDVARAHMITMVGLRFVAVIPAFIAATNLIIWLSWQIERAVTEPRGNMLVASFQTSHATLIIVALYAALALGIWLAAPRLASIMVRDRRKDAQGDDADDAPVKSTTTDR